MDRGSPYGFLPMVEEFERRVVETSYRILIIYDSVGEKHCPFERAEMKHKVTSLLEQGWAQIIIVSDRPLQYARQVFLPIHSRFSPLYPEDLLLYTADTMERKGEQVLFLPKVWRKNSIETLEWGALPVQEAVQGLLMEGVSSDEISMMLWISAPKDVRAAEHLRMLHEQYPQLNTLVVSTYEQDIGEDFIIRDSPQYFLALSQFWSGCRTGAAMEERLVERREAETGNKQFFAG